MTQEPIQQLEDKHNESEEIRTTRLKGQNKFNRPGKKQQNILLESKNYIKKQILVTEKENGLIFKNQQKNN